MRYKILFVLATLILLNQFNINAGLFGLGGEIKYKFTYDDVVKEAKNLVEKPYQVPETKLPESIINMSYIDWTSIQYLIKNELWLNDGLNFRLSFFPLGTLLYTVPVEINIVTENSVTKVPFNKDNFTYYYDKIKFVRKEMPVDAGYAGFKVAHQASESFPEFAVFLGKSYFRVIPDDATFGLSNRGIAINTGLEDTQEEFPSFEKFWILKPEKGDNNIVIYALLNGPSITGAYSFDIYPDTKTEVKVKSTIFLRNKVSVFGLAPMTSMFWFSGYTEYNFYDYRPQVHNSEGLLLSADNNIIWQPLVNYPDYKILTSDTHIDKFNYFGLIQRSRNYNDYLDPNVRYELNTNAWITPDSNWGTGILRLFQLQSKKEWIDNVNVYWIPDSMPKEKEAYKIDYTIHYSLNEPEENLAKVKYTDIGVDQNNNDNTIFVISFDGEKFKDIDVKDLNIKVDVPNGVSIIPEPGLKKIPYNNTVAALFTLNGKRLNSVDDPYIIKCAIFKKDKRISEMWLYQWYPPKVKP